MIASRDPADRWVVAIPSYRRPDTIRTKTLPLLLDRGIPADRITIYVADGVEAQAYTRAAEEFGVGLQVSAPTLAGSRNWIMSNLPAGTRVVQIDDDLNDMIRWVNPKRADSVGDLAALLTRGFELADRNGLNLWGTYAVPNPYFMKPVVRHDLRYIPGGLWGATVLHLPHQLVTLEDKEDFERSLRYYVHDSGVIRMDDIAPVTRCYREPGGMQETRTEQRVTASAHQLLRDYPGLCTLNTRKKQHTEVVLRDSRLRSR